LVRISPVELISVPDPEPVASASEPIRSRTVADSACRSTEARRPPLSPLLAGRRTKNPYVASPATAATATPVRAPLRIRPPQDPSAVVACHLGAGQRGSDAEFRAGGRIAEAQHHRLGDAQRPAQLLAVEERPPPGLIDVGGTALVRGDHTVALPGHQRVH
jgi:hypothetical protein